MEFPRCAWRGKTQVEWRGLPKHTNGSLETQDTRDGNGSLSTRERPLPYLIKGTKDTGFALTLEFLIKVELILGINTL